MPSTSALLKYSEEQGETRNDTGGKYGAFCRQQCVLRKGCNTVAIKIRASASRGYLRGNSITRISLLSIRTVVPVAQWISLGHLRFEMPKAGITVIISTSWGSSLVKVLSHNELPELGICVSFMMALMLSLPISDSLPRPVNVCT